MKGRILLDRREPYIQQGTKMYQCFAFVAIDAYCNFNKYLINFKL